MAKGDLQKSIKIQLAQEIEEMPTKKRKDYRANFLLKT